MICVLASGLISACRLSAKINWMTDFNCVINMWWLQVMLFIMYILWALIWHLIHVCGTIICKMSLTSSSSTLFTVFHPLNDSMLFWSDVFPFVHYMSFNLMCLSCVYMQYLSFYDGKLLWKMKNKMNKIHVHEIVENYLKWGTPSILFACLQHFMCLNVCSNKL